MTMAVKTIVARRQTITWGWSAQGIARCNQLFEERKKEREILQFEDFETYCMEYFL
jgi:hypothetical protein